MNQYILLIQGNTISASTPEEWERFLKAARESGIFKGGSEVGERVLLGDHTTAKSTEHITGYMRFDSDDKQQILELLKGHPVLLHGGSVELCELPRS